MTTRALGPAAGWRWLIQAINLGRNNPKAVFGAVVLVALVAMIPSLLQALLQYGLKLGPEATMTVVGLVSLLSILVYPLLFGGLLRVIDAAENGRPTEATAVFAPFKAGQGAARMIGFGVLMTIIYLALFVLVLSLFGKELWTWYWNLVTTAEAMQKSGQGAGLPSGMGLPDGIGTVATLGSVVGLFLGGVYTVGFGQVALGGRGVGAALGDGVAGTLKNLLPLLVLAVLGVVGMLVVVVVLAMVGGMLMLLGKTLGALLLLPIYFGLVLVMYVVMFGVMYFMWRDICGEPAANLPARNDQLEV